MSKKYFIALADALRSSRPEKDLVNIGEREEQWGFDVEAVADACQDQNGAFNRQRWMDYINGECGPSGGKVGK